MWEWVEKLLVIEAMAVVTVLAIGFPIAAAMWVRDLYKTFKRNRR